LAERSNQEGVILMLSLQSSLSVSDADTDVRGQILPTIGSKENVVILMMNLNTGNVKDVSMTGLKHPTLTLSCQVNVV
jgi:hypothetical protein